MENRNKPNTYNSNKDECSKISNNLLSSMVSQSLILNKNQNFNQNQSLSQLKLKSIKEIKTEKSKLEKEKLKKLYNPEEIIIRPTKEGMDREEYKQKYLMKYFNEFNEKTDEKYKEFTNINIKNKDKNEITPNTTFHTTKSSNFRSSNSKMVHKNKAEKKNILDDFDFFTEIDSISTDKLFGINSLKINKKYEDIECENSGNIHDENLSKEDLIYMKFMKAIKDLNFSIYEYIPNNELLNIKTTSREINDSIDTYMIFKNSIFSILSQEISSELNSKKYENKDNFDNKFEINQSKFKDKFKFSNQPSSMYKGNNKNEQKKLKKFS